MAIVDPTYLVRERNGFPVLTDKEFEALCVFSQSGSRKDVALFKQCTPRQVSALLSSCKDKLATRTDADLMFSFTRCCIRHDRILPGVSEEAFNVVFACLIYETRAMIADIVGMTETEVDNSLSRTRKKLQIDDLMTLKLVFVTRLALLGG